jgi:chromosome segregation ATPase
MMHAEIALRKAEQIREDIDAMEKRIALMRQTVALSDHPLWQDYKKSLQAYLVSKNNQLLTAHDDAPLEVVDRHRAILAAEVRLLDMLINAPDRFKEALKAISAQIAKLKEEADELERTYSFTRKGAENG